jgi:uncharacterized protein YkwD
LDKYNVNVKGYVTTAVENTKLFLSDIGNSPTKSPDQIYKELSNQDFIGDLGTTTKKENAVKSYVEEAGLKNTKTTAKISIDGIIYYTNIERKKAGLNPLTKNTKLNASAGEKVDDMFSDQYFEHTSPNGKTAADLVKSQGYGFQVVGENLALGVFQTDQTLVQAWMNSPTHRANILNAKYTEMGAAVGIGEYKGQRQWMAVQHFAKPLPLCKEVDEVTQKTIDNEKADLELEERNIQKMAGVIESDPSKGSDREYISNYNAKVSAYNDRLNALRIMIEAFNKTIVEYNTCVKG